MNFYDSYPEIKRLAEFVQSQGISTKPIESPVKADFGSWLEVQWGGNLFSVLINDEYDDLCHSQPLLNAVLVLREFELLEEADDYLHWLTMQGFEDPELQLLPYFKELVSIHGKLLNEGALETMDSFISDWDFGLNAGAAQYLRSLHTKD